MITNKQIIKTTRLSKQELRNIRNLMQECAKVDKFQARLYWNILKSRQIPEFDDLLYFVEGKLVAYLALFVFKEDKAELNAIVHPEWRRRGLFSYLLEEAALELKRRKLPLCDFICHSTSEVALNIAKKYSAVYKYSECEMRAVSHPPLPNIPEIEFRLAKLEDIQILAEIDSACFHTNVRRMVERFTENFEEQTRQVWIAAASGQYIGKAHIRFDDDNMAFIHDLGVLPTYQGKGYAKAMVIKLRENLKKEGYMQVALDVLKDNETAIKLYERCGFELIAEHQFWEFPSKLLLPKVASTFSDGK